MLLEINDLCTSLDQMLYFYIFSRIERKVLKAIKAMEAKKMS